MKRAFSIGLSSGFLLLALIGILFLVACQSASTSLDKNLVGLWLKDGTRSVFEFNEDGTFRAADKELLEVILEDFGTYELNGTTADTDV